MESSTCPKTEFFITESTDFLDVNGLELPNSCHEIPIGTFVRVKNARISGTLEEKDKALIIWRTDKPIRFAA